MLIEIVYYNQIASSKLLLKRFRLVTWHNFRVHLMSNRNVILSTLRSWKRYGQETVKCLLMFNSAISYNYLKHLRTFNKEIISIVLTQKPEIRTLIPRLKSWYQITFKSLRNLMLSSNRKKRRICSIQKGLLNNLSAKKPNIKISKLNSKRNVQIKFMKHNANLVLSKDFKRRLLKT